MIEEKVHQHARAWEARRPEVIKTFFTDDAVFVAPGISAVGPDQIEQAAADYFNSSLTPKVIVHRIEQIGDKGFVQWRWEETSPQGQTTVFEDAIIFETRDGLFSYWREYFDTQPVTLKTRAY